MLSGAVAPTVGITPMTDFPEPGAADQNDGGKAAMR